MESIQESNDVHYALHKTGFVQVLSLITNWCQQAELSDMRKKFLSMDLNYKIDVPFVVQWSLLWFSAPTRLKNILGREQKIKKYHEVVNRAVTYAISRPFGGEHTPRL